ncbi:MAG: TonB-dependent receptor [Sphingomonadales bacterium]|nr:TonB-dependent receptor [Sphingomonadales bacterium]
MKKALLAGTAMIFAMSSAPVWAQSADQKSAEDEAAAAGDIVVTATRSETLLSKTPLALTAVTGDALRDQGITGPTDLGDSVPNLSIDRTNGLQITIRGVTSTDGTEKGDPSAAFLLDGIYLARPQQADIGFFDVARVEVLRGPQGTLYGRNTTAGVVNVITNKPEIGKFGVGVNAGYGNYNAASADGYINLPAGDMAAFRVAATFDQRDSYIHSTPGDPNDNVDRDPFRRNFAIRGSALVKLGDRGDLMLRANYGHLGGTRATGVPTSNFYRQTANGTATTLDANGNAIWSPIANVDSRLTRNLWTIPLKTSATGGGGTGSSKPFDIDDTSWGIDGELNYDLGGFTVTYLGSYREYKAHENSQLDIRGLLPASLPGFLSTPGAGLMDNFLKDCTQPAEQCNYPGFFDGNYQQQSHEFRIATNGDGPLKLQAGGYYFREHSVIGFYIPDFPEFIIGSNKLYGFPQETTSKTLGAFAQGTYAITPAFRLTAGVRYTHDDKFRYGHTVATNNINSPIVIGGSTYANDAEVKNNRVTWRLGFDADLAGGLAYGSIATGYKQGGFGDGCSTGLTTKITTKGESCAPTLPQAIYYQPETLTAYELGYRGRIMDGLRIDTSVFYYDYKNMQLSSQLNINGAPTLVTTNAGKSSVFGLEFQAFITPVKNFSVNVGFNITDAKYKHFCPGGTVTGKPLDACSAGTPDFKGRPLDRSPKQVAFASFDWTVPMGASDLVLSAGTRLTSRYSITQFGAAPTQYFTPSHSNSQASLTFNAPDRAWYLQAYVKNIENFIEVRNATSDSVTPGDPRTFGVRAGFKF